MLRHHLVLWCTRFSSYILRLHWIYFYDLEMAVFSRKARANEARLLAK